MYLYECRHSLCGVVFSEYKFLITKLIKHYELLINLIYQDSSWSFSKNYAVHLLGPA